MNKYKQNKKIKVNYGIFQSCLLINVENYWINNWLFIQIKLCINKIVIVRKNDK